MCRNCLFPAVCVTLPHGETVASSRRRLKHSSSTLPTSASQRQGMPHHRRRRPLPGAPDLVPHANAATSTMVATALPPPLPWSRRKEGSGGGRVPSHRPLPTPGTGGVAVAIAGAPYRAPRGSRRVRPAGPLLRTPPLQPSARKRKSPDTGAPWPTAAASTSFPGRNPLQVQHRTFGRSRHRRHGRRPTPV